jgi:hypothetical protein
MSNIDQPSTGEKIMVDHLPQSSTSPSTPLTHNECHGSQSINTDYDMVSDTPTNPYFWFRKWNQDNGTMTANKNEDQLTLEKVQNIYLNELSKLKQEIEKQFQTRPPPLLSLPMSLEEQLDICHNHLIKLQKKIKDNQKLVSKEHVCSSIIRGVDLLKDYPETTTLQENMFKLFTEADIPLFWIIGMRVDPESKVTTSDNEEEEEEEEEDEDEDPKQVMESDGAADAADDDDANDDNNIEIDDDNDDDDDDDDAQQNNKKMYTAVIVTFINEYVKKQAIQMLTDFFRSGHNVRFDMCHCQEK